MIEHLESDLTFKSGVDGGSCHVHTDAKTRQRAFAFDAGGKSRMRFQLYVFFGPRQDQLAGFEAVTLFGVDPHLGGNFR